MSSGHTVPTPPKCLHELGRSLRIPETQSADDGQFVNTLIQCVSIEVAHHQQVRKFANLSFNSRCLHHFEAKVAPRGSSISDQVATAHRKGDGRAATVGGLQMTWKRSAYSV